MTPDWTRRNVIIASGAAIAAGLSGCLSGGRTDASDDDDVSLAVAEVHQYSSPGCSCCSQYAAYLGERIDGTLTETTPDDIAAVKRQHGVPDELQSCHTLVVGDYVVEGHVPATVIETLLGEEPAIDGIALPGMPAGSPGMGGSKQGQFTIHEFDDDQASGVYAKY
ncbi:DUF411 domain-containing protein [Halosimplex aquaticum]|uniref:DUF411 domain-containing protein n=1 Tax=Halosimplex aquaticum TaxID=3026162 RepID=A0ABD5Y2J9_9EURY|nr:DUF411 domain-containing protein [Halosimplex aquaticum]